jgi:polysaccharide pyruvyl transferase WcaK-like protein
MSNWLLLIYKVPNEPSARRVYVWRKLKKLAAILVQDSVWVLPANPKTREKLQWLAAEIKEMQGGEASLWEAQQVFTGQDGDLIAQFNEQVNKLYQAILNDLQNEEADLSAASKLYQQARLQDYFDSELGKAVRDILLHRKGESDS